MYGIFTAADKNQSKEDSEASDTEIQPTSGQEGVNENTENKTSSEGDQADATKDISQQLSQNGQERRDINGIQGMETHDDEDFFACS